MYYIVYKTINLINKKEYIGVHKTKDPNVFDGYLGCGVYVNSLKKNDRYGLPAAIRKYGSNNFKRIVLYVYPYTDEGCDEAYSKEAELVTKEYVNRNDTYNRTIGGVGVMRDAEVKLNKPIAQYDLNGKFIRKWESISDAERSTNITSIQANIYGKSKYAGDYQWRFYNNEDNIDPVLLHKVYQFDLSGKLINIWNSANDASKIFENHSSARSAIINNCKNITRKALGFYWSYSNYFAYKQYFGKMIQQYSLDGLLLNTYNSIKEAVIDNKLKTSSGISSVINGKQKTAHGYIWKYIE